MTEKSFDQLCIETQAALVAHKYHQSNTAITLGVARTTVINRIKKYHARDLGQQLPGRVLPGQEVKSHTRQFNKDGDLSGQTIQTVAASSDEPFEVPNGHRIKGVSALMDADGIVKAQWLKTTEGERSDQVIADAAKHAAETYAKPAAPMLMDPFARDHMDPKLVNLHLLPDLHIGLHSSRLTAQMDWSLDKAITTYSRLFRLLAERSPFARKGVVLGGGDLLHADDPMQATRGSGNRLDVAEPYDVVLGETEKLMVHQCELALQKYEEVEVRLLKGNHDPDSAVAIAHFLAAWFRDEPRIWIDLDPSLFWFYQHGICMLAATHGHETKINQMPGVMAADRRAMWGATEVAYAHGFHIHHATKGSGEEGGATWETHQAPTPRDDWHQGKPFRSRRSLPVVTYHEAHGEVGRTMETLI
jgi:hypothetical protein